VLSLGGQKANVLYNKFKKVNYASKPNNLQSFILKLGSNRDFIVTSNIAAAKEDVSPGIK
jgi:hypothetical protein